LKHSKPEALKILREMAALLNKCGFNAQAAAYQEMEGVLSRKIGDDDETVEVYKKIRKSLFGMGSFDDIPLEPWKGATLSNEALRKLQVSYATQLAGMIDEYLEDPMRPR
jgi:hypothetical protein